MFVFQALGLAIVHLNASLPVFRAQFNLFKLPAFCLKFAFFIFMQPLED